MNKVEFLTILKDTCAKGFKWERAGTSGAIRAKLLSRDDTNKKDDAIVEYYTPITAVTYTQNKGNFHPADDREAGEKLNLTQELMEEILHASDFTDLSKYHSMFMSLCVACEIQE